MKRMIDFDTMHEINPSARERRKGTEHTFGQQPRLSRDGSSGTLFAADLGRMASKKVMSSARRT